MRVPKIVKDSVLFSPPANRNAAGLSGNDVNTLFPLFGFLVCILYFANKQRDIVGDYMENQNDPVAVMPVGNYPLRKVSTGNQYVNFTTISEPEQKAREQRLVLFLKNIQSKFQNGEFSGGFTISSSGSAPLVAKARDERLVAMGLKKAPDHETETIYKLEKATGAAVHPKSADWWVKRYTYESMFTGEDPETRFLPMSFVLGGLDIGNQESSFFHGAVKKLVVESDVDLLAINDVQNAALKFHFTLVDTNWRNINGQVGPREIHLVTSQENNWNVVTAVLDKEGGTAIDFSVTFFAFRMEDEPVAFASNVLTAYKREGFGFYPNSLNLDPIVRVNSDNSSRLLFALRVMCTTFRQIEFMPSGYTNKSTKKPYYDNIFAIVSEKRPLPIELVATGPDGGQKLVYQIRVRTSTPMRAPEDLDWDSNSVRTVMLSFVDGSALLLECATCNWKWVNKDRTHTAVAANTVLDLMFLSELPSGSYTTPVSKLPKKGIQWDINYDTRRYSNKISSSRDTHLKVQADFPRHSIDIPETEIDNTWLDWTGTDPSSWVVYTVILGLIACLFGGWIFPSGARAWRVGQLTALMGVAFSVYLLFVFIGIRFEIPGVTPFFMTTHDKVIYYYIMALFVVGAVCVLWSLRFNHRVPESLYVCAIMMVSVAVIFHSMPITNGDSVSDSMRVWRAALVVVMFKCVLIFSWECLKMGIKSLNTPNTPAMHSGIFAFSGGPLIVVICIVLLFPLVYMLKRDTKCDELRYKLGRSDNGLNRPSLTPAQTSFYTSEKEDLKKEFDTLKCSSSSASFGETGARAIAGVLVLAILVAFVASPVLAKFTKKLFPSRTPVYLAPSIENSKISVGVYMTKLVVSVVLLLLTLSMLLPEMKLIVKTDQSDENTCKLSRNSLQVFKRDFANDSNSYAFDSREKITEINDDITALDCSTQSNITIVAGVSVMVFLWIVTIVTPSKFTYTSKIGSFTDTSLFMGFATIVIFTMGWLDNKARAQGFIQTDFNNIIRSIGDMLTPPI